MILQQSFYDRDTILVAQELLGKTLIYNSPEGKISGIIVETEAYLAFDDPASHNYKGKNLRNEALFGQAGHAYIHSIHRYFCMDVVTEGIGRPGSVLLRAVEPIEGVEIMQKNRGLSKLTSLTSGPGKLCQAFGINMSLYGVTLNGPQLFIESDSQEPLSVDDIYITTRIGISHATDKLLRFYVKNSQFISKK